MNNDQIIAKALTILESRMKKPDAVISSPDTSAAYIKLKLSAYEHETFACLFLDNRHRVIAFDELFKGTVDGASVYPREVVKAALRHNAAAVILCHNHPSGVCEPSNADKRITDRLKDALALVDIRVFDHIVVGGIEHTSFAECGYL